jgi:hypothetical protein
LEQELDKLFEETRGAAEAIWHDPTAPPADDEVLAAITGATMTTLGLDEPPETFDTAFVCLTRIGAGGYSWRIAEFQVDERPYHCIHWELSLAIQKAAEYSEGPRALRANAAIWCLQADVGLGRESLREPLDLIAGPEFLARGCAYVLDSADYVAIASRVEYVDARSMFYFGVALRDIDQCLSDSLGLEEEGEEEKESL